MASSSYMVIKLASMKYGFQNIAMFSKRNLMVDWTINRFPITKDVKHNVLKEQDIAYFEDLIGKEQTITDTNTLAAHNVDWFKTFKGNSQLLLKPKSTEEVSKIMTYCNAKKLPVCTQGGNTGVVGGATPVFDEIILSLSLLNKIQNIDGLSGVVTCEAGCILELIDEELTDYNLIVPLDLPSKGSCQIGGNISTNAGGIRVLRYGNLHGSVLGLEVVLPNGEVLDLLSCMRKDNTGYDLKHLFIGSEGTLGIITKANIQCVPKPQTKIVAFLCVETFEQCLQVYHKSKTKLSEILSACEFADHAALQAVKDNFGSASPFKDYPFYVLLETSGSNMAHDEEKMHNFLNDVMADGLVCDGTSVSDSKRINTIWSLRENMAEAMLRDGYMYTYDVSLPLNSCYEVVKEISDKLEGRVCRCSGFGHLGDGNLHLTVSSKVYSQEVEELIVSHLYERVRSHKGSVSAEHGVGISKKKYMHYSKSTEAIALMKQMKLLMDPNNILNPYKVIS